MLSVRIRWRTIRRVWVILGASAGIIFVGWSLWAFRASGPARRALESDGQVAVVQADAWRRFAPRGRAAPVGLLLFPGGLVDPVAYAPLAHAVAAHGYVVLLVDLPRRGAFGGADDDAVFERARTAMRLQEGVSAWVVAGHSKGGAVAARMVHEQPRDLAGLVLIGTTHPRDFSLAGSRVPVTRIAGTRDSVASLGRMRANDRLLPASTRTIEILGGNHSQFGYYGFQPGDRFATISRERQQAETVAAILAALDEARRHHVAG
jgi:pimeloyl-ACP methyl ester carboxylesterase